MKQRWLVAAALLFLALSAGAQSVVPDSVYANLDSALTNPAELTSLLAKSSNYPWYPKAEAYVLKKARQLVIENRLSEAKAVSLAVIDNNLDNADAVELYQSIEKAEKRNQKEADAQAEKAVLEAFRQQAAQAKVKQEVAKTYQSVTNATSGKTIYLDQSFNRHYRTWNWDFLLELADIDTTVTVPGEVDVKYGLGLRGGLVYHGDSMTVGGELDASSEIVTFTGTPSVDWTGGAVLFLSGSEGHVAFRLGGRYLSLGLGNEEVQSYSLATPVVGLSIRDIQMGEGNRFKWFLDWYPGHLYTPGLVAAGATGVAFAWRMADLQDFDIHFHAGIHDTILVRTADIKNTARVFLAIGVGDYE